MLQNFETHPTSKQHRIHLNKTFHFDCISKDHSNHVEFEILIGCTKVLILIFQMTGQEKSFKKKERNKFFISLMILILRKPQIFLFF
jgi:hypothetical protein